MIRQSWPKTQPRRSRRGRAGFSPKVRAGVAERSKGLCELDACGPAGHIHHRAPRGRGGSQLEWINRAANALHVSARCHDRIERNRADAVANGWLILRNGQATAVETAVLYRGRWAHLTDYGLVVPTGDGAA
ncbi:hypothetical protein [Nocardia sp. CA-290969]|uniref:hypothetical protein n=1 Tax=Nocardia sp. CA-290969 TaxID=3239986 RepID=UPI003D8CFDEF